MKMKKNTILLLVATMAICSQAAQINWGSQGQLFFSMLGEGSVATTPVVMNSANGFTVTAYLYFLGGAGADWASDFDVKSPNIAKDGNVLDSKNANTSAVLVGGTQPYEVNLGVPIAPGLPSLVNNTSTFGILFIASNTTWEDGEFAWITSDAFVFSTTPTQTGASWDAGRNAFTYLSQNTGSGAVWNFVPIPEPTTAGLALVGLALLFRRKRK